MDFKAILQNAKKADPDSVIMLMESYRPLLLKESLINGHLDEDLYQNLAVAMLICIQRFRLTKTN